MTNVADRNSIRLRKKQPKERKIVMNIFTNKSLLLFLGGVALGILGSKAVKNEKFRQICLLGAAKGLQLKDQLGVVLEGLQENAADFLAEAASLAGTEEEEAEVPAPTKIEVPAKKTRARRATGTRKPRAKKAATK